MGCTFGNEKFNENIQKDTPGFKDKLKFNP